MRQYLLKHTLRQPTVLSHFLTQSNANVRDAVKSPDEQVKTAAQKSEYPPAEYLVFCVCFLIPLFTNCKSFDIRIPINVHLHSMYHPHSHTHFAAYHTRHRWHNIPTQCSCTTVPFLCSHSFCLFIHEVSALFNTVEFLLGGIFTPHFWGLHNLICLQHPPLLSLLSLLSL